jgi:hypothetical protein
MFDSPYGSVAGFVGYNFLGQQAAAHGCVQTTNNPFVCAPSIDSTIRAITEDSNFHSLRLGITGELRLFDRVRINAEAAWLPYSRVRSSDSHWLRIGSDFGDFSGPIPETGRGDGYQVEASVVFQATKNLSLGAGWRYWRIDTTGTANFSGVVVGIPAGAQPLDFTTERSGVFLQGAYRM